jgi:hypothetical protein
MGRKVRKKKKKINLSITENGKMRRINGRKGRKLGEKKKEEVKVKEKGVCSLGIILPCFSLFSLHTSALKMEAIISYETPEYMYQTTRRDVPGGSILHSHRRENLKFKFFFNFPFPSSFAFSTVFSCPSVPWPTYISYSYGTIKPILVASRSKAWVCGR